MQNNKNAKLIFKVSIHQNSEIDANSQIPAFAEDKL